MLIRSTTNLHYPITVTALLRRLDDEVERTTPLFSYVYRTRVIEGDEWGEEREIVKEFPANFESEIEGRIARWSVEVGTIITSSGTQLVEIEEPCSHDIQYAGMCTNCAKDMTIVNYNTSRPNSERAPITMSHGQTALTVSAQEAARVDDEAKRRLLANKRLSLVVDLDLTIIHATVDPTVAEWQEDEDNPNHGAVKDVRKFQLLDDGPGGRYTWYYIKLRPGLQEFLESISKLYELHIYTMGTRAYAENIAKIVDPDRKIFGDRVLSRNESGSQTFKTLQRLFPVDTKMVVIIDDRGDVWNWSPNLVKVKPYDFFVGIGDINSSYLPKRAQLLPTPPASPPVKAPEHSPAEEAPRTAKEEHVVTPEVVPDPVQPSPGTNGAVTAIHESLVSLTGGANPEVLQEQSTEQDQAIATQIHERPLLQKQLMLDKADEEAAGADQNGDTQADGDSEQQRPKHNLLHDNDNVLEELETGLRQIHRAFYEEYEKRLARSQGGRVAELRGTGKKPKTRPDELSSVPAVTDIILPMKLRVLRGVTIVFTGVVPLGTNIYHSDIAMWANSFGAEISENITRKTTHVVAARHRRTAKVRQAARHSWIAIVTVDWLLESISQWSRLDEKPFRIEVEPEERSQPDGQGVPSFEEPHEGTVLSSEEEDANATDEVATGTGEDEEDEDPDDVLPADSEDESAIPANADWDGMDAEMDEFLNETDDNESDGAESASSESGRSESRTPSRRRRKRKRDDTAPSRSPAADEPEDGDDNDANGSRLQKRRKQAMARTTSLTNVTIAATDKSSGLPSPESTGPDDGSRVAAANGDAGAVGKRTVDTEVAVDDAGQSDDDDDDDELEAEMMAEFAREEE